MKRTSAAALLVLAGCGVQPRAASPRAAAMPVTPSPPSAVDSVRGEARAILSSLVSIDTSAGQGQVPRAADGLAKLLLHGGFGPEDVLVLPLGDTASLVVRYRGAGGGGKPIGLLAHLDVVTAKRSDWQRDPFTLVESKGYLFGRGSEDVKCEIAALVETFLRLKREGFVPSRDLVLALSGDEETGMLTAQDLVERHRDLVDFEYALNADGGGGRLGEDGQPLSYVIQGAEKISAMYGLTVRNPGGHSSKPRPDNAIYELADALVALRAFRFPVQWNDWTLGDLRAEGAVNVGPLGAAMRAFADRPGEGAAAEDISMDPSFVGLVRTTCVATMLAGGHAENALAQSATATVNCRIFPGTSAEDVRRILAKVVGPGVEIAIRRGGVPSDPSPVRADVVAAVTRAVHAVHPNVPVSGAMAVYATDGAVYRRAGIPTYGVSGTFMKDSDDFAHGVDERISVDAFHASIDYWYSLLRDLGGAR